MRFLGSALAMSAIVLGACGGGGETKADSPAGDTATQAPATVAPAGGTGTAMPVTGTWHEVKMTGDASGNYKFEPAEITAKQGDGIRFIMVSGGPHDVAFDPATVPADVKAQLSANMPNQQGELSSPLFMNAGESYTISFANVKPGAYPYFCTPHLAMNMKGTITVQ